MGLKHILSLQGAIVMGMVCGVWIEADVLLTQLRSCWQSGFGTVEMWKLVEGSLTTAGVRLQRRRPCPSKQSSAANYRLIHGPFPSLVGNLIGS